MKQGLLEVPQQPQPVRKSPRDYVVQAAREVDIKQWFTKIITPDFSTLEAKVRLGSFKPGEEGPYEPSPRLKDVTRDMRELDRQVNKGQDYQSMEERPSLCTRWFSPLQVGGIRSTTIALVASALGSGCLALPYAFNLTGAGLALVTLFVSGLVSALSLQVLMMAARYTGSFSYAALLELATGTSASSYVLDVIMLFNGLGSVICCLIFQGDFVPAILRAPPGGMSFPVPTRDHAVIGAALAVWPLAIPDDIQALRYVGIAVPVALMVVTLVVICDTWEMHDRTVDQENIDIVWWKFDWLGWLKTTSIFLNAFTNQMNGVQCAEKFQRPSVKRIVKTTVNSSLVAGSLYAILGFAGYASFMGITQGDFLLNYPDGRPELWVIRIMLSVIVYVALPVSLLPAAKSGAQLLFRMMGYGNVRISPLTHAISATGFLIFCLWIALNTSDVATVINIVGGLLATPIMFFFPAAIYYQILWPVQPKVFRWPVMISMLFFGFVGLASVALNEIYMKYFV